jgi:hypothetical protein
MTASSTRRSEVNPDDPIRLSTSASLAFPDGSMTGSGLRKEALRGRLVIERIAGTDFATLAVCTENSNPNVLVMKSAQDGV